MGASAGWQVVVHEFAEEDTGPDDRQEDVDEITHVENEADDREVVEELPPVAPVQGHPDTDDHEVVGEIGRIKDLAHRQIGQALHESQAGLEAKNRY